VEELQTHAASLSLSIRKLRHSGKAGAALGR
jgi:hypothetical protein